MITVRMKKVSGNSNDNMLGRLLVNITADSLKVGSEVKSGEVQLGRFFVSLMRGKDSPAGEPTYWLAMPYNSTTKKKVVELEGDVNQALLEELTPYIVDEELQLADGAELTVEMETEPSVWVYVNPLKAPAGHRRAMATIAITGVGSYNSCVINENDDGELWLATPSWLAPDGTRHQQVSINSKDNIFYDAVQNGAKGGYKSKAKKVEGAAEATA